MKNFENKVAVITGASRGIGKAIALEFAREGAKVVVNYHISDVEPDAESNAQKVSDEIKSIGSECLLVQADISKEDDVRELMESTMERFGRIDILVNNAGIAIDKSFENRTLADWEHTIKTNLYGPFLCSQYASEYMKKQKSGNIINISSTNGINRFSPESMDYDAAKAGLIQLTRNLAKELAPYNIRVNAVAPGWVDTDMNKDLPSEFIEEEKQSIYLKRFATPEEIARPVIFLASDDARYITGQTLIVDGGMR